MRTAVLDAPQAGGELSRAHRPGARGSATPGTGAVPRRHHREDARASRAAPPDRLRAASSGPGRCARRTREVRTGDGARRPGRPGSRWSVLSKMSASTACPPPRAATSPSGRRGRGPDAADHNSPPPPVGDARQIVGEPGDNGAPGPERERAPAPARLPVDRPRADRPDQRAATGAGDGNHPDLGFRGTATRSRSTPKPAARRPRAGDRQSSEDAAGTQPGDLLR